ncbi:MAG: hypothetical protein Q4Q30_00390 [Eggerthella sp.]|nr:hypothetical protein [Eggerthella sp.]
MFSKQLAEPRDLERHEAVKSLFCAVLTDLRVFVFAADPGLTPEGRRKASGPSGEQLFWRAVLLARNPSEGWLVTDFGAVCRYLLLSRQRLSIMKDVRKAQTAKSLFEALY